MPDEVLTLGEISTYLKVTERTIAPHLGEPKDPTVQGRWLLHFRLTGIAEWLKAQSLEVSEDKEGEPE